MAAVVWQRLADTSDELRLAFSDLQAVDEQVAALAAGAHGHSLSEAAVKVQQAAEMAKTRAVRVLKTAKAADVAASKAVEIVAEAQAAKAIASEAAARAAETARVAAALEAAMAPSVPVKHMRHTSSGGRSSHGGVQQSGAPFPARAAHADVKVAVKTGESGVDQDDGEDQEAPSSCAGRTEGENADLGSQRARETEHGIGAGEDESDQVEQNLEEEKEDEQEKRVDLEAKLGKRTLVGTSQVSRRSLRVADIRQPSYAESPTREPTKRQRKASTPESARSNAPDAVPAGHEPGKIHLLSEKCAHPGCSTHPTFDVESSKKREYCLEHGKRKAAEIASTACGRPGCAKRATFGVEGSKKTEFCAQHAKTEMVNVVAKKCGRQGCATHPTFGVKGGKKREFCLKHAKRGMVNVAKKRCGIRGCATAPYFGVEGSKKAEFCLKHAKRAMVNVVARKCSHPGCATQVASTLKGRKKKEFCAQHAKRA